MRTQDWLLVRDDLIAQLAPEKRGCRSGEARCLPRIGPAASDLIAYAGAALGLAGIGWLLARGAVDRRAWAPLLLFMLAALVLNAFLCGSFSAPVPRYQARISWLIPAMALMMAGDALRRRRQSAPAAGSAR
jgi:hypothetical protein